MGDAVPIPEPGEAGQLLRDEDLDFVGSVRVLMRALLVPVGMLLRRRSGFSGPLLLLLLGLGFCLYQTLIPAWNRVRSALPGRSRGALDEDTRTLLSYLAAAQVSSRDVTAKLFLFIIIFF